MRSLPMTKRLLQLACACALVLVAVPAVASAGYSVPFKVSVKGTIDESWHHDWTSDYDCHPRTTGSGSASIAFATAKPASMRAHFYGGWRGNLIADVQATRNGTITRGGCYGEPQVIGGDCGARSYKSRVNLDYEDKPFNIGLFGDRRAFLGGNCEYAPDAFPEAEQEFDSFQLLWNHGPKVPKYSYWIFGGRDGKGHDIRARRQWTIHYKDHIARPYYARRSDGSKVAYGEYAADVEYWVTFRRVGKIWRPRGT
jgi:hypothetical protein